VKLFFFVLVGLRFELRALCLQNPVPLETHL
jgi:hypothetical protein